MIVLDLSILNQKGTPMFNSDTFANRPAFGIVGRIFISIDTAAIYRDTGTAWDLIADGGSTSTNIYNSNGTLTGNRVVSDGGFSLTFNPSTTFDTTLTAASNTSSLAIFGVNRLSYAGGFSSNNTGNLFGGSSSFNLQTFAGSATFANSNIAANSSINSIDFSTGGSTITMTQATGLRVMAGHINMFQYQGTNSGTITHAAVSQNLGFYRPTAATGILTITNAYGHLINDLNDYGAGFTFTNRFGIYQAGASDINYFAAYVGIGTNTPGNPLDVHGSISSVAALNQTTATNNTLLSLLNSGTPLWRIGNFYTAGANDFGVFDVVNTTQQLTIVKATGQTFIGAKTTASGRLVVNSATADNHLQIVGANAPSIRIDNAGSGGTQKFIIGNATATNNFIQGSAAGDFCITTASAGPLLFGMWQTINASEVMRITTTNNLLIGSSVDGGQRLQITGNVKATGHFQTLDRYLWGTATDGTTGQIVTNNVDNFFDYLGTLYIRNSTVQGIRCILDNNGNFTFGSVAMVGSNNIFASAATFTGTVAIANAVTASVATPSTHKVSILIAGVQYYLLASNI